MGGPRGQGEEERGVKSSSGFKIERKGSISGRRVFFLSLKSGFLWH